MPEHFGHELMGNLSYSIAKRIQAPVERVWACWLEPEHLKHWFCPADFEVLSVRCERVVKGKWHVSFQSAQEEIFETCGEFLELVECRRLRMTQQWKGSDDRSEICISLSSEGETTVLRFEHSLISSKELVGSFRGGWEEALVNLERYLLG